MEKRLSEGILFTHFESIPIRVVPILVRKPSILGVVHLTEPITDDVAPRGPVFRPPN